MNEEVEQATKEAKAYDSAADIIQMSRDLLVREGLPVDDHHIDLTCLVKGGRNWFAGF